MRLPRLAAKFCGTGDLVAALLLAHLHRAGGAAEWGLARVMDAVGSTVAAVLRRTLVAGETSMRAMVFGDGYELELVGSADEIRRPRQLPAALRARPCSPAAIHGVLFDMDGTLTEPHQLDFVEMRRVARVHRSVHKDPCGAFFE